MREDLMMRQEAEQRGFVVLPDMETSLQGQDLQFRKGDIMVWHCTHNGKLAWAVARLVPIRPLVDQFTEHAYLPTLADALNNAEERHHSSPA